MRYPWILLVSAASIVAGIGIGRSINTGNTPDRPPLPENAEKSQQNAIWERMLRARPGYVEIPSVDVYGCKGTQSGVIRIRLSKVLMTLHEGKTITRDLALARVAKIDPEAKMATLPSEQIGNPNAATSTTLNPPVGFPTQLDFSTGPQPLNGTPLVAPSLASNGMITPAKFAVIRVILDTEADKDGVKGVEFLRPLQGNQADSGFAVMRSAATTNTMFCARREIVTETVAGRLLEYVDFGVQSTGKQWGSFGIGLLVRDPEKPYVLPIILDPQVKNEG